MIFLTQFMISGVVFITNSCPLPADLKQSSCHDFLLYVISTFLKKSGKSQNLRDNPSFVRTRSFR